MIAFMNTIGSMMKYSSDVNRPSRKIIATDCISINMYYQVFLNIGEQCSGSAYRQAIDMAALSLRDRILKTGISNPIQASRSLCSGVLLNRSYVFLKRGIERNILIKDDSGKES